MQQKITTAQKRALLNGVPHVCHYCGISESDCADFFKNNPNASRSGRRGAHLEVDKIDPSEGYDKGNVVWACYICNNCKSNYCKNEKDFEPIAKGIREFWKNHGYRPL